MCPRSAWTSKTNRSMPSVLKHACSTPKAPACTKSTSGEQNIGTTAWRGTTTPACGTLPARRSMTRDLQRRDSRQHTAWVTLPELLRCRLSSAHKQKTLKRIDKRQVKQLAVGAWIGHTHPKRPLVGRPRPAAPSGAMISHSAVFEHHKIAGNGHIARLAIGPA